MPTTRKERSRVVVKREVVRRERGWREGWGGIASASISVEVVVIEGGCYELLGIVFGVVGGLMIC